MRRNKNSNSFEGDNLKIILYVTGTILTVALIAFIAIFIMYSSKIKKSKENLYTELGVVNELVPNLNTAEASSTEDKPINEVKNEIEKEEANLTNETKKEENKVEEEKSEVKETNTENVESDNKKESEKVEELEFSAPVEGEIIKDFASDTLVYSETLKEWITHFGIDIAADKTSIVRSSEAGKIESIKNDPRYGLTIVIEHRNGYKSIYSNLLTTEFVSEGEEVDKGQTIGTIGDTAAFEISETPHLHFEIIKDGEYQNPTILLK